MYPIIYPGYSQDMDSKEFKELKKNGYDTDKYKSDATSNDDGTLSGKLADEMYPYYVELVKHTAGTIMTAFTKLLCKAC